MRMMKHFILAVLLLIIAATGYASIPVITLSGANPSFQEAGNAYSDPGATATDAVDGTIPVTIDKSEWYHVSNGTLYTTKSGLNVYTSNLSFFAKIYYSATNSQGGVATATRIVNIVDTTPPVITLIGSSPVGVSVGSTYTELGVNVTDNCGNPTVTTTGAVNTSVEGTYTLTYTTTDSVGLTASTTRTVIVGGVTIPTITMNGANPYLHEVNTAYTDPGATAFDAVDGVIPVLIRSERRYVSNDNLSASLSGVNVYTFNLTYYTKIIYSATNSQGGTTTAVRIVNIIDTTPPVINLRGINPMTVVNGSTFIDLGVVASDNGGPPPTVIIDGTVNTAVNGVYPITYTATDASGNTTAVTRIVNVASVSAPIITLAGDNPASQEVYSPYVDAGATAIDPDEGALPISNYSERRNASNNAPGAIYTGIYVYNLNTVYYTDIFYVASNSAGVTTIVKRRVNLVDTTPPIVTLKGNNPMVIMIGSSYVDPGVTATDNYSMPTVVTSGIVNTSVLGDYTITYTATDTVGNQTVVTRTVRIVQDATPPVITLNGTNPLFVRQGSIFTDPGATAVDLVDGVRPVTVTGTINTANTGNYTLTYTSSDIQGAVSTATRTVTVTANTTPSLTSPGNKTVSENSPLTFILSATDAQGDAMNYSATGLPTGATLNASTGVFTWTPNYDQAGTHDITFFASDGLLNSTGRTITVTVNNVNRAPTLTSPGDKTVNGGSLLTFTLVASDPDTGALLTYSATGKPSGSTLGSSTGVFNWTPTNLQAGNYNVTFTVSDGAASDTKAITITVNSTDTTAPVVTINGSSSMIVRQGGTFSDPGATATDAVDGLCSVTVTGSVNVNTPGTYNLTYSATDTSGITGTATRTVTVTANTAPAMSNLGGQGTSEGNPLSFILAASDAQGDPLIFSSANLPSGATLSSSGTFNWTPDFSQSGNYSVTFTVSDGLLQDARSVSIHVDNTNRAPSLNNITDKSINGGSTVSFALDGNDPDGDSITYGANTLPSGATLNSSTGAFSWTPANIQAGVHTITFSVSDGNASGSRTMSIMVASTDTVAPVVTLVGGNPLTAEAATDFTDPGATAVDAVDGAKSVTVTGTVNVNLTGTYTVTYSATDVSGNTASRTRTVYVTDTVGPVITVTGLRTMSITYGSSFTDPGATAVDAYSGSVAVTVTGSVNANQVGSYSLTYRAVDAVGNASMTTRTVNVTDGTPPTVTVAGANPITIEAGSAFTDPGASATDAIDGACAVTVTGTVNSGSPGTYTLTYNATDAAGNSANATRTVRVVDTTPPAITLNGQPTMTVSLGGAFTDPGASATDSVSGACTVTKTGTVNTNQVGSYTLTYSATDAAGNTTSRTRTVSVIDGAPPVIAINGGASMTVEAGSQYFDAGATALDAVDGVCDVESTGSVDTNRIGTYSISYSSMDSAGNTSLATRTVIVIDTTPPDITLIGETTVSVDLGQDYIELGAVAVDLVSGQCSVTITGTLNNQTPGTYTLTYMAKDEANNNATTSRTVNIYDTTPPVITIVGQNPMTILTTETYVEPGATANDAVSGSCQVTIDGDIPNGTPGTYIVTYTATDAAYNTAQETRVVTITDNRPPVVTLHGTNPMAIEAGTPFLDPGATATDVESGELAVSATGSVNVNVPGNYTVTYTAVDPSGNTSSVSRTVRVLDNGLPLVTLRGDNPLTVEAKANFVDPGATAMDAIEGSVPVTVSGTVNTQATGTYTLTYTARDSSNNTSSAIRTVIVVDSGLPRITLNGVNPTMVATGHEYVDPGASAVDAIDGDLTAQIDVSGTLFSTASPGTHTVTYTVVDSSGNVARAIRTVTVQAPAPPSAGPATAQGAPARTMPGGQINGYFLLDIK